MHISFDGIPFDVVRLNDWVRTLTRDESQTDFLYYEHVIDVDVVLNANATAADTFPPLVSTRVVTYDGGRHPVGSPAVARNVKPVGGTGPRPRTDIPQQELLDALKADPLGPKGRKPGSPRTDLTPEELADFGAGFGGGRAGRPPNEKPASVPTVQPGPGGGIAAFQVGRRASASSRPTVPMTDVELRERLRRPRRQLAVWLYTGDDAKPEYLLYSPHPGCGTDARTGPECEVIGVQEIHGNVTGVYRLSFRTWEAPALEFTTVQDPLPDTHASLSTRPNQPATSKLRGGTPAGNSNRLNAQAGGPAANAPQQRRAGLPSPKLVLATPALLSNRWQMRFEANPETYLMDQIITGVATFRMDVLQARGLSADMLRGQLFHPIPKGYIRKPPRVELNEAGDSVAYEIEDVQQLMNFPGGAAHGIIHIEVDQTIEYIGYDKFAGAGG